MKECASGTTLGFRPWSRWMMPLVIHLPLKSTVFFWVWTLFNAVC